MQETVDAPVAAAAPLAAAPAPAKHADLLGTASPELSRAGAKRQHYPALDGLRGLAVLMVMFFHYHGFIPRSSRLMSPLRVFGSIGWMGVTLFFVLSGFLITGILVDAKGRDHYFRNFYARRMLRIFPLYFGVLLAVLVALCFVRLFMPTVFLDSYHLPDLWAAQPWLWTYTTNILMAFTPNTAPYLSHFWSLAIEEQFYLVWPFVVYRLSRRSLLKTCVGIFFGVMAYRYVVGLLGFRDAASYCFTPAQVDSLATGGMLALLFADARAKAAIARLAPWLAVVAAAWVGAVWYVIPDMGSAVPQGGAARVMLGLFNAAGPSALVVLLASALTLAVSPGALRGVVARIFEWKPLRVMGGYSYGLYVFHPLVLDAVCYALRRKPWLFADAKHTVVGSSCFIVTNLLLSFAVAFASFHLYEKHFLKLKRLFPARPAERRTAAGPLAAPSQSTLVPV